MFGKKIKCHRAPGIILGLFLLVNLSCQRDDICPESTLTTPLLKISFYDNESPSDSIPKPPINLSIKAASVESNFVTRANASEISIPLRTDVDFTTYEFILNARAESDTTSAEGNKDVIAFTYARNQIYINRACSYKITYVNLTADLEAENPVTNNWIKEVTVVQPTIEDEKNTNIIIFH